MAAIVYKRLPDVLSDIVAKNLHELYMADLLPSLQFGQLRRLKIIMQHYASEGRIRIIIHKGGKIGQSVYLIHPLPMDDDQDLFSDNIGRSWNTFDEQQNNWMTSWREERGIGTVEAYTDEDWYQFSKFTINHSDNISSARIMLNYIPDHPAFAELEDLRLVDNFITHYPGFIPIYVMIPTLHISTEEIPLTTMQLSIKYGFKETADIVSQMMYSAEGLNFNKTHEIFANIMEHLIHNPTILIHSSRFRSKLCQKIEELQTYIDNNRPPRRYRTFYDRIQLIINRIKDVLQSIRDDPLYVEIVL